MQEEFICYLWQFKLWEGEIRTKDGRILKQLSAGTRNTDAGPDFFNARIVLDDTQWAGNVEIHTKASEWYKHKHHLDKSYDNIVLHVVYDADMDVKTTAGVEIPVVELKNNIPKQLFDTYKDFMDGQKRWIPCEKQIHKIDVMRMNQLKERLLVERLERKTTLVKQLLEKNKRDWSQAFFVHLSSSLGLKTNHLAFEMLAKSLSVYDLAKIKSNLFQLEAVLFGQSGLLAKAEKSDYASALKREYAYLKKTMHLKPLNPEIWKFMQMRPTAFPTIRIAQLAYLIHNSSALFSALMEFDKVKDIRNALDAKASEFWDTHYHFNKTSPKRQKKLGMMAIDRMIINTVAPFFFVYGNETMNDNLKDKALKLLLILSKEKNTVIDKWISLGIVVSNAFDSQALLELKSNYCDKKRCLECRLGNYLLHLNA
jgi:hypothetical protein